MSLLVPGIHQRPALEVVGEVGAVGSELVVRQRLRPGDQLAGDHAARSAFADAVLHRGYLARIPLHAELAEYPAVVGELAVPVVGTFPRTDGRQVGWLER